jgi:hypothetical protein
VGRNLLQIFGPIFVKCYTFHIAKQQHIILSRTVQSKYCIAISRIRFVHAPMRRLGPRSYLLYSLASCTAKAVFGIPIVLPNKFLQGDGFSVMKLSKKLWMLLLFPCPGTIPVPSCKPSCQMSCCAPPSSGCVAASLSRLSTAPTTAPTPLWRHRNFTPIHSISHWSSGSTVCFPSRGSVVCVTGRGGHAQLFFSQQSQFRNLKEALPQSQFRNF